MNKSKSRSSKMKALGEERLNFSLGTQTFSFGTQSKNSMFSPNKLIQWKAMVDTFKFAPYATHVAWKDLPGVNVGDPYVNAEESAYGSYARNWEYCYVYYGSFNIAAINHVDKEFYFVAEPNIIVAIKKETFKSDFKHTFGIDHDVWESMYGKRFYY
jgi:hypothetical protein